MAIRVAILGTEAARPSSEEIARLAAHGIAADLLLVPRRVLTSSLRRLFAGRRLAVGVEGGLPDVIHAWTVEAADLALGLASRWDCPYVVSIEEFLRPGEGFRLAKRLARGLLVPDVELGRDLIRSVAVPERLISRIPFGVPMIERPERAEAPFRPAIGTAVGTGLGMGLPIFYEAASRVLAAGVEAEFVVAAEPGRGAFARGLADAMGLCGRVAFVDEDDLARAFWPALDVYCHPARRPTTGRPLLDALARGVPSIASDVAGLREISARGLAAKAVPPGDPAALADAMLDLLANPAEARRFGLAGQARVAERNAPGQRAEGLALFYRAALAPAPAPRRSAPAPASASLRSYTLAQQRKS